MTGHTCGWRKSSFSGVGGNCVEVAEVADGVLMRNSNRIGDGSILFPSSELAAFVAGCKAGDFDDLA